MNTFEERYLSGRELYGDDMSEDDIAAWFDDEREGYAELGAGEGDGGGYGYDALNTRHGFRFLPPGRRFERVLGIGSAYGRELRPIADRVDRFTILEPSNNLVGSKIGSVSPEYVKPDPSGVMPFPDASFDLVLCFGTLHHIPNVSAVVGEIGRVTKPGELALIREPIVSMGDWRGPRKPGVTKRERGIPLGLMLSIVEGAGFDIVRRRTCIFPGTQRVASLRGRAAFDSPFLVLADELASRATQPVYRYHATKRWQKIRPSNVFVVGRRR